MNSLTPFIRHEQDTLPGPAAAPEPSCTRCSPPLGKEPQPVPPPAPETPGRTPHPGPGSAPHAVLMTDGTPTACRQKNAREFLAGDVQTSVMAHYASGMFGTRQHTRSAHPAPEEDASAVLELVDWREDAPYG